MKKKFAARSLWHELLKITKIRQLKWLNKFKADFITLRISAAKRSNMMMSHVMISPISLFQIVT